MGFLRVRCEHSVWVYGRDDEKTRIIVPVFVDDITIAGKDGEAIRALVKQLETHFKLRDLGETRLSQRQYVIDILERANMADCKPVSTPLNPNVVLSSSMGPTSNSHTPRYCIRSQCPVSI